MNSFRSRIRHTPKQEQNSCYWTSGEWVHAPNLRRQPRPPFY